MNHIYLHIAKPKDLIEIIEIERSSFLSPWSERMFLEEMSNPHSRAWTAKRWDIGSTTIGYIFYQLAAFEMHILNLAVHPDFRNQGVGTFILSEVIKKERLLKSARYVYLEVRANNAAAIALYKKLGFKELGVRKNYYQKEKTDAIIMGRPIKG